MLARQYVVFPLAIWIVAMVTIHSCAIVLKYDWQWGLAKWGWPLMMVAGGIALVQLGHWTVRSVLHMALPAAVLVTSIAVAWHRGDVHGSREAAADGVHVSELELKLSDAGQQIDHLKAELFDVRGENIELKRTLAAAKPVADAAIAEAAAAKKETARSRARAKAKGFEFSDFTDWLPVP